MLRRLLVLVAVVFGLVAAVPATAGGEPSAIGEGLIIGTVTDADLFERLDDILVIAYSPGCEASGTWSVFATRYTDASGRFEFQVPAGRYIVRFVGEFDGFLNQFYDGVPDPGGGVLPSAATELVVTDGAELTGIDASLESESAVLPSSIIRLAGRTRYETAAAVTQHFYDPGVPAVFISRGDNFPDALAGGPPAAMLDSPMLLVGTDGIPSAVAAELTRLVPKQIYVLGGDDVVSSAVESQLAAYTSGAVTRLEGRTRYETAVAITQRFYDPGVQSVFIARGDNFPDALAGVPAAALKDSPLLLVRPDSIPPAVASELGRLAPTEIFVLGGSDVVSSAVEAQLSAYTTGAVRRLEGRTRYETAVSITSRFWDHPRAVFVARGDAFPDALAGGPPAGTGDYPLLLVETDSIPAAVGAELARLEPETIYVLGGSDVVSDAVAAQLATYVVDRP